MNMKKVLSTLGIDKLNEGAATGTKWLKSGGEKIDSYSPVDGRLIASVTAANQKNYEAVIKQAQSAFEEWRMYPAPKRGEIVRQIGEALRKYKDPLGRLVSYEMGDRKSTRLNSSHEWISRM